METPDLKQTRRYVVGAGISAAALMLLTALHHIYGAFVYQTPWRSHVAFVSLWSTLFIGLTLFVFYRKRASIAGRIAFWLAVAAITLIPIGGIGLFEGVYNHLLKNILFFSGVSVTLLHKLFPPPTYHLPDNVIFEVTGVLQVLFAVVAAFYGYKLFLVGRRVIRAAQKASSS